MCLASITESLRKHTLALTDDEARYLVRLITGDVLDNAQIARSPAFASYGPVESRHRMLILRQWESDVGLTLLDPKGEAFVTVDVMTAQDLVEAAA